MSNASTTRDGQLDGQLEMGLDELPIGQAAEVQRVNGPGAISMRLLEMGFVPGTTIELVKRAPLGDPLELRLRGYHLSLRRAEAAHVRVVRR